MGRTWKWLTRRSDTPGTFGKLAIVMFVLVQCLDGISTYITVITWEIVLETNPVIFLLMSKVGVGIGLMVAKLAGIIFGIILYWRGVHNIVAMLTVFYFIVVVLPWLYLFLVPWYLRVLSG